MILRRLKLTLALVDNIRSALSLKPEVRCVIDESKTEKTAGKSGRKPSERFMKKALSARSRASISERIRMSDLVGKLVKDVDKNETLNEYSQFNGFRPGNSGPPG